MTQIEPTNADKRIWLRTCRLKKKKTCVHLLNLRYLCAIENTNCLAYSHELYSG